VAISGYLVSRVLRGALVVCPRTGRCLKRRRRAIVEHLIAKQKQLMERVPHGISELTARRMVAGLGIIEETLEYLNSTGHKPWRPNPLSESEQLEELTDILFFYLEEVVMSGFTWGQIEAMYDIKFKRNLDRYERASKGDYGWDDRDKKGGL